MRVPARPKWTDAGIAVTPGERLRFEATGTWRDWTIDTGPEGFERAYLRVFAKARRVPAAPWFALCGALNCNEATAFVIGAGREWVAPAAGQVFVFANDVPWAYFNNQGEIELSVTRL